MAQRVKDSASKLDDLSLINRTYMIERTTPYKLSLNFIHAIWYICIHTC